MKNRSLNYYFVLEKMYLLRLDCVVCRSQISWTVTKKLIKH